MAQKCCRTPFHLRKRVEKKLEKMIKNDIIEEVFGIRQQLKRAQHYTTQCTSGLTH